MAPIRIYPRRLHHLLGSLRQIGRTQAGGVHRVAYTQADVEGRASAETLLEAIKRASDLTIRGIEGILAEASFAMEVLPTLSEWAEIPPEKGAAYDFLLTDGTKSSPVRLQVKMQRRKNHLPWMANQAMKKTRSWPADHYVVEVLRTRGGKDSAGEGTRPYRFDEFDILAVSLGAAKGEWSHFIYSVARWLLPEAGRLCKDSEVSTCYASRQR